MVNAATQTKEMFYGLGELSRIDSINAIYLYVLKYNGKIVKLDETDPNYYVVYIEVPEFVRFSTLVCHYGASAGKPARIVLQPQGTT